MRIAIGSDHAGYELKEQLKQYLLDSNYEVIDVASLLTTASPTLNPNVG